VSRLQALGAWLKQNGEAIYGTHPWTRAEGSTNQVDASGNTVELRFTQKPGALYATLMAKPVSNSVLLHNVKPAPGSTVALLGASEPLKWSQKGADVEITLPATLPGSYAWVVKLQTAK
jgi:alpha-L-fucosidase